MIVQILREIHGRMAHWAVLMMMVMDGLTEKIDSSMIHLNGTMLTAMALETTLEVQTPILAPQK